MKIRLFQDSICAKCEAQAIVRMEKKSGVCKGFYEDEDGNMQMEYEETNETVSVCDEHAFYYVSIGYEVTEVYGNPPAKPS